MITIEQQHQVALALARGATNQEAAKVAGIHYNTVTKLLKRPDFLTLLAAARDSIQVAIEEVKAEMPRMVAEKAARSLAQRFEELAPRAVERLGELMEQNENLTVAQRCAESILDRSSEAPKRQIHTSHEEDKTIRIYLDAAVVQRMDEAMRFADEVMGCVPEDEAPAPFPPQGMVVAMARTPGNAEEYAAVGAQPEEDDEPAP